MKNRIKILFVGHGESTHAQSFVKLFDHELFDIRFFCLPTGAPVSECDWLNYVNISCRNKIPPGSVTLYPHNFFGSLLRSVRISLSGRDKMTADWLGKVIDQWKPSIVHSFGLNPSSFYTKNALQSVKNSPVWVIQARGSEFNFLQRGPNSELAIFTNEYVENVKESLSACDKFIADNLHNYNYAEQMNLKKNQLTGLGIIPGTGGIDLDYYKKMDLKPAVQRGRTVLYPKAYDCPYSKALPVIKALKIAWRELQPCSLIMTAVDQHIENEIMNLPEEIRSSIKVEKRVSRERLLSYMADSRVMLAPSISDGIPNVMYEAMACGTFPVVSPLDTISEIVSSPVNVLFAENMNENQIAEALIESLNNDEMIIKAIEANLEVVDKYACRKEISVKINKLYKSLVS